MGTYTDQMDADTDSRTSASSVSEADRLWVFVCSVYALPGVRTLCLDWQTRFGADIPLLLALCWQARRGAGLPDIPSLEAITRDLRHWRQSAVFPLRRLRDRLKPLIAKDKAALALRKRLLDAELLAERVQLAWLAEKLPHEPLESGVGDATGLGVERYLNVLGLDPKTCVRETDRLTALIPQRFPESIEPPSR